MTTKSFSKEKKQNLTQYTGTMLALIVALVIIAAVILSTQAPNSGPGRGQACNKTTSCRAPLRCKKLGPMLPGGVCVSKADCLKLHSQSECDAAFG